MDCLDQRNNFLFLDESLSCEGFVEDGSHRIEVGERSDREVCTQLLWCHVGCSSRLLMCFGCLGEVVVEELGQPEVHNLGLSPPGWCWGSSVRQVVGLCLLRVRVFCGGDV